ncbi:YcnI family protein [Streptacidiphilus sp. EB129]|uniref:YcnI family copper-binding membrane protein n=1 Tax=Streptacidiphilus sp. EB129 TaxID=3156262 RepID=UPI0035159035
MRTSLRSRIGATAALATAGVLLVAGPASAHVTVQPSTAAKGASDQTFSFRVPNEKDTASTTEVQVYFPADHPIPSVLADSTPGWKADITTTKLKTPIQTDDGAITDAVSAITWTGGSIAPGHYQDFTVDFGQLPSDADELDFKALQTYSDGTVVRWIQTAQAGQPEPANPAPVLRLTAAANGAGSDGTPAKGGATGAAAAPVTASGSTASSGDDSTARVLGAAGLVVGLLGVGFGFLGWRRGGSARNSE